MTMFKNTPIKRTFLASRTQDPELKARYNATGEHSQYQPSHKFFAEGENYRLTFKTKKEAIAFILKTNKKEDSPEPGKQYALTGATGSKAIGNGSTWEESVVKTKCEQCGNETDLLTKFTKYQVCGKCTRKNQKI